MQNTKNLILKQALVLFARKGYEAVSVREIAGALGITQGALYKHFASKHDILAHILGLMEANDLEYAAQLKVPEQTFSQNAQAYRVTSPEAVECFSLNRFIYWTQDDFASDFRRMLTIEQYRSPEMSALYDQYLAAGVINYLTDLFREMPEFASGDEAGLLAVKFYAPIYMLMNLYDSSDDKSAITALAEKHISDFFNKKSNLFRSETNELSEKPKIRHIHNK